METKDTDTLGIQLKKLISNGQSLEEASELLGIDADAAKIFISNDMGKVMDADELLKKYKAQCVEILFRIAADDTIDNITARVQAAKVFVEGRGELPEFPVDKLSDMYKKMKGVVEKGTSTINNPSPATSIVSVKFNEKIKQLNNKEVNKN